MTTRRLIDLEKSINFLHVAEIREICDKLKLPNHGRKGQLIARIIVFLETGQIIKIPKYPEISRAKKGQNYPISPNAFILDGAYKNDLKTRLFFKKLIGSHFHFTAFGQDWTRERWLAGNPPTYQEFADMWQNEYTRRKKEGAQPKTEWAFINFTQQYIKVHPNAARQEIHSAWEDERLRNKEIVEKILAEVSR